MCVYGLDMPPDLKGLYAALDALADRVLVLEWALACTLLILFGHLLSELQ